MYLAGEGLPVGCKPFFVSMPLRRGLGLTRFKEAIRDVFLDDYEKLIESEFDEDKFTDQVCFYLFRNAKAMNKQTNIRNKL
jgi:hypothetical protein